MTDPWLLWAWLWLALIAAWLVLGLAWSRRKSWQRYLRRVRAGRAQQARDWQDLQDAERRKAAEWVRRNCFWSQP